jgi:serine/threonine-protein phosphatase 5
MPSTKRWFLFNGDFVDRGNYSTEVLLILYAFKLALPGCVFLNRGNHEHKLLNSRYNFTAQVKQVYDEPLYKLIAKTFSRLPYCSVINDKVFVVHGGLTSHTECGTSTSRSSPFDVFFPSSCSAVPRHEIYSLYGSHGSPT